MFWLFRADISKGHTPALLSALLCITACSHFERGAHTLQACRQAAAVAGQSAFSSSSGLNMSEGKVASSAGWAGSGTGATTAWPASLPFLSRQAAQAGPGDAHQQQQQQRPVLCRLLATGPVVVLDQRLCRRGSALRAGLSHLLGSRKAATSGDMAGASAELWLARTGTVSRCQQAL